MTYNLRHYWWPRLKYRVLHRITGRTYIYGTVRKVRGSVR